MELININTSEINGETTNSVDARELHDTLGVKKAFTTWIKTNLDSIGAVEDEDYIKLKTSLEGSGYKKVFIVSVDIAKHICMMSKTKKGKEIRDYFIQVEKSATVPVLPQNVMKEIKLALAGVVEVDKRIDMHHERIQEVELYIQEDLKSRPISFIQQKALQDAHHKKVYQLSPTDEKIQRKLHRRVWSLHNKQFNLPRYSELPAIKFDEAVWFINNLEMNDMLQ